MKNKLLLMGLIVSLCVGAVGCSQKSAVPTKESAVSVSAESSEESSKTESKENSVESEESEESEESSEASEPTEPRLHGQELTDIACKFRYDTELTEILTKVHKNLTDLTFGNDTPCEENPEIHTKSIELSFHVSEASVAAVVQKFISAESYNMFIEKLWITYEYDGFRCKMLMYHPYPKDDTALTDEQIQSFIKDRFRSVDRAKLMSALLSIHQNYHTQSLSMRFTPDKSETVGINAKVDFSSYNGYSRYTYQITHSNTFKLEKSDYTIDSEEGAEYPCHSDITIRTDQFTLGNTA